MLPCIHHNYSLGDYVKDKDRCKKCKGKRTYDEEAKLKVHKTSCDGSSNLTQCHC